jgi:hypothetical protein
VEKPEGKRPLGSLRSRWENNVNKKFWEQLIAFLLYDADCVENDAFNHSYIVIRCRGKDFIDPLPSNDRGIHIQTHRLMGGIYEDVVEMHTKFHKDWFRHSKVDNGEFTDTQTAC